MCRKYSPKFLFSIIRAFISFFPTCVFRKLMKFILRYIHYRRAFSIAIFPTKTNKQQGLICSEICFHPPFWQYRFLLLLLRWKLPNNESMRQKSCFFYCSFNGRFSVLNLSFKKILFNSYMARYLIKFSMTQEMLRDC